MAEGNKSPLNLSTDSDSPSDQPRQPLTERRLGLIFVVLLLVLLSSLLLGRCGIEGDGPGNEPNGRAPALVSIEAISAILNAGVVSIDFDVVLTPAVASAETVDYQVERTASTSEPPLAGTVSFAPGESRKSVHLTFKTGTLDEASLVLIGGSRGVVIGGVGRYRLVPVALSPKPALSPRQSAYAPSYKVTATAYPAELGRVSGAGVFKNGGVASLLATPLAGSEFIGWHEGDAVLSTSEQLQLKVNRNHALTARFRPRQYRLTVSDVKQPEGNHDVGNMTFAVTLSSAAESDLSLAYATRDGSATGSTACGRGVDYIPARGTLTIRKGSKQAAIEVAICGDDEPEEDETFVVALTNLAAHPALATLEVTGTLANDDPAPSPADAVKAGADMPLPSTTLAWLKLDAKGKALSNQSAAYARTPWSCVLDRTTGLMWEVKSDDEGLHDKDWTYTWYNTNPSGNGGHPGSTGKGYCGDTLTAGCNTEKFVAAVNAAGLCGANDWRLPTQEELQSLVDPARTNPAVDSSVFPNMLPSWYWSSSPVASDVHHAWLIGFYYGYDVWGHKSHDFFVRLVRAGR